MCNLRFYTKGLYLFGKDTPIRCVYYIQTQQVYMPIVHALYVCMVINLHIKILFATYTNMHIRRVFTTLLCKHMHAYTHVHIRTFRSSAHFRSS